MGLKGGLTAQSSTEVPINKLQSPYPKPKTFKYKKEKWFILLISSVYCVVNP